MNKKLYVGNLNYNTTEERLRELFEQYGKVMSAKVVTDFNTGMSRGFGFIEMSTFVVKQHAPHPTLHFIVLHLHGLHARLQPILPLRFPDSYSYRIPPYLFPPTMECRAYRARAH